MFCVGIELESKNEDSCFLPIQPVADNHLLPGTSNQADSIDSKVEAGKALRGRSDCQSGRVGYLPRTQTNQSEVTEQASTYAADAVDCQTEVQRV